ncbi:MAG: aspartate/glutamate racemase family protein [Anaerolineae bacterium]|nr:aspartate/glutamate racemase family protein [Anaerolineae bacterium]
MRVRAITPLRVSDQELMRRQARYNKLSPANLHIDVVNLPAGPDVPTSLDTAAACRASDRYVYEEAMRTDPARYDAILLDCVLDPALDELERDAPVPTYGMLKLTAGFLISLGHEFAAVTRNQVIGDELQARLEHYGMADKFHRLIVLDLSFADITDDSRWNASIGGALDQLEGSNTRSLINGCSAVDVHRDEKHRAAVVDPTALALTLLGVAAETHLLNRNIRYSLEQALP